MKTTMDCLLAAGVFAAWLGVIAFFRMPTPLQRLHVAGFVNVVAAAPIVLAALLNDGISARALKCVFTFCVLIFAGALFAHATGAALHFRGGERR